MASTYLSKTFSSGNTKTWTWSGWIKKSKVESFQTVFSAGTNANSINIDGGSGTENSAIGIDGFYNGTRHLRYTSSAYRDVNGWYHVVVAVDTTQATDSNRIKLWVNGSQVSLDKSIAGSWPAQNSDGVINSNVVHSIGRRENVPDGYFDGSMAHVHFTDGTAYDASTFGEYDSTTGIWTPIFGPSVTYGTNGFFLKFENSGSMGTDSSGNANNFTVNGTCTQNIDTPSNVFSTMNALNTYVPAILSTGNLKISGTGSDGGSASTLGFSSGKWYWEVKYTDEIGGDPVIGIVNSIGANKIKGTTSLSVTSGSGVWCLFNLTSGGVGIQENGVFSAYPPTTLADGDILNIALDVDAQKLWYGKNGTWFNSGDPANGTNATSTNLTSGETWFAYLEKRNSLSIADFNFGNGYFGTTAVASAQNPDDGIGIFEYSVPTGYKALCTKSINAQEYS